MADSILGRFLWYELLTSDMKAAEQFYKPVVGWTVTPFEGNRSPTTCGPGRTGRPWEA